MATYAGDFRTPKGRFAIVAARFNLLVVERLVEGARDGFRRHGVADDAIDVVLVPGSLEIPLAAQRLADSKGYAAIVCAGAVVRGDTAHFDVVVNGSANGMMRVSLETGVPVLNAVLTTDTMEQALDRAGGKAGNKGFDAAVAAIETVNLLATLPASAAK